MPSPSSKGKQQLSTVPVRTKRRRVEKAAVYRIDGVSVDVTDLLNIDFELLDMLHDAMVHLSTRLSRAAGEERASYLSNVLTAVADIQTDRVLRFSERLAQTDDDSALMEVSPNVKPSIAEQCKRLNRLRDGAEKIDYVSLHTGGQDDFSAMALGELHGLIRPDLWLEMQIRLRASAMLSPSTVIKVARWVARGLMVRHAIIKVQIDTELYAN